MSSNLILIICLLIGLSVGFFSKTKGQSKIHSKLLFGTILVLLFIMGAILGFAPDLPKRMVTYGYNAFVIAICALVFSALTVAGIVKITKFGKQ